MPVFFFYHGRGEMIRYKIGIKLDGNIKNELSRDSSFFRYYDYNRAFGICVRICGGTGLRFPTAYSIKSVIVSEYPHRL